MAQAEPENVNSRTVQLVKLLAEVGPDVPEISRRLGQFKESVRYRYKEKILNKGFAVQAVVDHQKLGLKRMVMVLDFADDYRKYAQSILVSMSDLCFLVSFAKTMPEGYYVADFSVPKDLMPGVKRFFETMKDKGMFKKVEALDFDWIRVAPMKSEFYDFDTGRWDFDWTSQADHDFDSARYAPSELSKFDSVDLLILKELQMDANKSLKEISDKLEINYKKLAWHYSTHVLERKLLNGYSVNWMGTRYDFEIEKALHRQHRYMGLELIARNLSDYEIIALRQKINGIPFLWAESVGRNYAAQLTFPVDCVVDGLQFLTEAVAGIKEKVNIYTIDQTDAGSFTMPYGRYDASRKAWTFDESNLIVRFEELIIQIKKGTD
ncbi:MAG: hypothetical protein HY297_01600 [Thaumarchaeota archaeon]|nr:hypothetical protein [Nitrososphaerota archaeon]